MLSYIKSKIWTLSIGKFLAYLKTCFYIIRSKSRTAAKTRPFMIFFSYNYLCSRFTKLCSYFLNHTVYLFCPFMLIISFKFEKMLVPHWLTCRPAVFAQVCESTVMECWEYKQQQLHSTFYIIFIKYFLMSTIIAAENEKNKSENDELSRGSNLDIGNPR